jgi:hypothetical protein
MVEVAAVDPGVPSSSGWTLVEVVEVVAVVWGEALVSVAPAVDVAPPDAHPSAAVPRRRLIPATPSHRNRSAFISRTVTEPSIGALAFVEAIDALVSADPAAAGYRPGSIL